MNPDIKTQWVEALRSGKYKQGDGALNSQGKYCCLGVLCDLAEKAGVVEVFLAEESVYQSMSDAYDNSGIWLPEAVRIWAGLESERGALPGHKDDGTPTLADMNDEGIPFGEIASTIEAEF